ncbi:unnamed protein product [Adineta steineri]|uniref:Gag-like protein n=1 Tax=Adineta steineri TaxID=433720 RepID=A0A814IF99_9BILA|nr:unnamed protein product [Adineta steineri]CAF1045234.1 unnamed protein product [Adineta steineri]
MSLIKLPLEGFQTISDQSEIEYWQDQMKNDGQFIQFMTEIFKKKKLETLREQKNINMNHQPPLLTSSQPPPVQESIRHLPNHMDQPVVPSNHQQQYSQSYGPLMDTINDKYNANPDYQDITTSRRTWEEVSPEYQVIQRTKKHRPHETSPRTVATNVAPLTLSTTAAKEDQHHHLQVLPSHVKRAITSNLPCFFIKFRGVDESDQGISISAMKVAELIRRTIFQETTQTIRDLSLLIPVGKNRFKVGVTTKKSFLLLWKCKWPDRMDNFEVEVERPRALPDCCALVVRNVPTDLSNEFVYNEITKSITSAVSLTKMNYHRQRPTNDFRFCVPDEIEYNEMIDIGRIAIGQMLLPVTTFQSSLKMTFCTNCWELGHIRPQCKVGPRCRLCLDPWDSQHTCNKPNMCAQCHGPHSSLSMECSAVRSYRRNLKEEVSKAVEEGRIKQVDNNKVMARPGDTDADFPSIQQSSQVKKAWNITQRITTTTEENESNKQDQLSKLNIQIGSILEVTQRLENKFDNIVTRIESLEKISTINKQGIMVLANILQQTINASIGKKQLTTIMNLAYQIEKFKEDLVEKFNTLGNNQVQADSSSRQGTNDSSNHVATGTGDETIEQVTQKDNLIDTNDE